VLDRCRTDYPRFVAAHAVAVQLDSGYNLATMDREEFERRRSRYAKIKT
jgi:hypothetical protein